MADIDRSGEMKKITLWYQKHGTEVVINHFSDGWVTESAPVPNSKYQESSWKNVTWKKTYRYLNQYHIVRFWDTEYIDVKDAAESNPPAENTMADRKVIYVDAKDMSEKELCELLNVEYIPQYRDTLFWSLALAFAMPVIVLFMSRW